MSNLTKLRPMTPEEIRHRLHVAIVVHLDRLPQLKGKGKANFAERQTGISCFVDAVFWHFERAVWMTPIEFLPPHLNPPGWSGR